jgi:hypothetical protein
MDKLGPERGNPDPLKARGAILVVSRYILCVFPICVIVTSSYWASLVSSGFWISMVGSAHLALNIVIIILSAFQVAFIVVVIAELGIVAEEGLSFLVFGLLGFVTFILAFALLGISTSRKEVLTSAAFVTYCSASCGLEQGGASELSRRLLAATSVPATPTPTATRTPEVPRTMIATPQMIPPPTGTPCINPSLEFYAFCEENCTPWSKRRYARRRLTEQYALLAGFLAPWFAVFIGYVLLVTWKPKAV